MVPDLALGLIPKAVAAVLALAAPTVPGVLTLPGRGIGMALATGLAPATRVEMRGLDFLRLEAGAEARLTFYLPGRDGTPSPVRSKGTVRPG